MEWHAKYKWTYIVCRKPNVFLWILDPKFHSILTHNINLNANLANGTLVREHSLAFDSIDEKHLLDDLIRLTPMGGIKLQTFPILKNSEIFLTSLVMIIPHLNSKASKDMNGNMDPIQMMWTSSFLLSKNCKISQWISFCLWRTIVFQCINGSNGWSLSNWSWILYNYSKSTRTHHT